MRSFRIARGALAAALFAGFSAVFAVAQDETKERSKPEAASKNDPGATSGTSKDFSTRKALNSYYEDQFADLDKRRIADMAALAPKLKDQEQEATYADIFNLAVTRDQYYAAEKAAETFLASGKGSPQTRALASFVNIMAATNRSQYDLAVKDLDLFLKGFAASTPDAKIDPNLIFAVGEGFLQRLIKAREYDSARKVCRTFVSDSTDPNVKAHFEGRLARLEMLGRVAPQIVGQDVDGKKITLADHKGKVVLVDFWATWAPPCVAQVPYYNALQSKYGSKGFQVLGVNVDTANQNLRDKGTATAGVRRFLLAMRVAWPSVLNGTGSTDFAKAYGVTDIPANFLIDRDGKIIQVELSDTDLDKAIEKAVGGADSKSTSSDTKSK